ncbi:phosphatase PAP2 family protein [Arthrobacter cryoconiti]|uniref:Phosphatase PAP2 family protein n=1 Tax=Arthrobacter cryoconiti TaxID=748907 RepID=A0ABV8R3P3_9MICC|nr:phosphatase PAP2 family protein [Arthrobacter cryoconiti]MCC9069896.1 phosphatase PAP2 family protein [Arthrobacter cryoconiti]
MRTRDRSVPMAFSLVIASTLAFCGVNLVLVHTAAGQRADSTALGQFVFPGWGRPPGDELLGSISITTLLFAVGVIVAVLVLRKRWRSALLAGASIGATVMASQLLKDVLIRPEQVIDFTSARNSFPSGHAAISAGVCVAVGIWWPKRLRTVVVPALAILHGLVVASVMTAGWHRASDVLGSSLLALGIGFLFTLGSSRSTMIHGSVYRVAFVVVVILGITLTSSWAIIGSEVGALAAVLASVLLVSLPPLAISTAPVWSAPSPIPLVGVAHRTRYALEESH